MMTELPIVVAMTGASGAIYGCRLLEVLLAGGRDIHLAISPSGAAVIREELGLTVDLNRFSPERLVRVSTDRLKYFHYQDFMAPMASGSFRTAGMAIVPCSMSTLAAIATGQGVNLIHRAADVHLKERRKLILTPRETPLSLVALENMTKATLAGAVVLPAMPGFYHHPARIDDLVDFVVARICDQLGLPQRLMPQWGTAAETGSV
jgi:4-hydroxy-3-polyprenylbenzoate decarboxylase